MILFLLQNSHSGCLVENELKREERVTEQVNYKSILVFRKRMMEVGTRKIILKRDMQMQAIL